MNVKSILVLLLSGGFFMGSHYWYCCLVKAACYGCAASAEAIAAVNATVTDSQTEQPLLFDWATASPIVHSSFGEEKSNWLREKSDDNLLQITGMYFGNETAPEGFDDMGFARADAVRKLLLLDLPDERIRLASRQKEKELIKSDTSFTGVAVRWIPISEKASNIINFGNKGIILFPSNSYKKESDKEIDAFLKSVAERVKTSGETIFLTGHTDNTGDFKSNLRLGKKRAMRIRRILRLLGVPREQIVALSKGDQEPIASNDTEKGRYQNRRVVLEIKTASR